MDLGLRDAHVVVVGASRGLGRGIARAFAREGARLALIARSRKGLEKTAAQCRELGAPEVLLAEADMSSREAVDAAFAEIGKSWSTINVLINNAANSIGTHGPSEKFADETMYADAYNVITLGYVRTTRAALPFMKAADWARIVNVSTASSGGSSPVLHIYNMSKTAVVSLSKAQAREFAPYGISVNIFSPAGIMVEGGNWGEVMNGYFEKHGLDPTNPYDAVELSVRQFGGTKPWMDRYGLIAEYADAITFLGSRTNSYMTGHDMVVHGGGNGD
ncbi:SDR family NAD(P)-dependent oxidoreductase [uncultured Sphingomonas sp.]|uniref:SDR family NAD(P)-dependent oxidoreductase n=1 Tax=uncultured Sphingomonas sp. TaxID=158754 RepID=UPI0035C9F9B2